MHKLKIANLMVGIWLSLISFTAWANNSAWQAVTDSTFATKVTSMIKNSSNDLYIAGLSSSDAEASLFLAMPGLNGQWTTAGTIYDMPLGFQAVTTDNNGNTYVAGISNNQATVYQVDSNQQLLQLGNTIPANMVDALTVDTKGNVYITVFSQNNSYYVYQYQNGNWNALGGGAIPNMEGVASNTKVSMAIDNNGNVYVGGNSGAGQWPGLVQQFNLISGTWSQLTGGGSINGQLFSTPTVITTDNSGNVYAACNYQGVSYVYEWSSNNGQWNIIGNSAPSFVATALAVGMQGDIYVGGNVADGSSSNSMVYIIYNGAMMPICAGSSMTNYYIPNLISLNSVVLDEGNVYVGGIANDATASEYECAANNIL